MWWWILDVAAGALLMLAGLACRSRDPVRSVTPLLLLAGLAWGAADAWPGAWHGSPTAWQAPALAAVAWLPGPAGRPLLPRAQRWTVSAATAVLPFAWVGRSAAAFLIASAVVLFLAMSPRPRRDLTSAGGFALAAAVGLPAGLAVGQQLWPLTVLPGPTGGQVLTLATTLLVILGASMITAGELRRGRSNGARTEQLLDLAGGRPTDRSALALVTDGGPVTDPRAESARRRAQALLTEFGALRIALDRRAEQIEHSSAGLLAADRIERERLSEDIERRVLPVIGLLTKDLDAVLAGAPATVAPDLLRARQLSLTAASELGRVGRGLAPVDLDDHDLAAALHEILDRASVDGRVRVDLAEPQPSIGEVVWYVVAEAVTNAVKHGAATNVEIDLRCVGRRVVLTVRDDGPGGGRVVPGGGLDWLGRRVAAAGGSLEVLTEPGGGTTVVGSFPRETR